eukprot:TRINITY_DN9435_c0_g1_i1.p1 TRINITY_DN9435_c0_g1~~TRINITY_DN9435_c0_g1_i1.p1  ORF type:complete len:102 (+),score=12.21 TRINITY_DN9435_c0_g1_i1:97-402(+)
MSGDHLVFQDLSEEDRHTAVVEWRNIDLQGSTCVMFDGLFAEYNATTGKIDSDDFVRVEYRAVGSGQQGWRPLVSFVANKSMRTASMDSSFATRISMADRM